MHVVLKISWLKQNNFRRSKHFVLPQVLPILKWKLLKVMLQLVWHFSECAAFQSQAYIS